jgi:hypothetical protein
MKRTIRGILSVLPFLCFFLCPSLLFSQADSIPRDTSSKSNKILLAKGNTFLEDLVAKIVKDTLTARGFSVKVIDTKYIADEQPAVYRVSIVFSGIKGDHLFDPVSRYATGFKDQKSNLLICTAYGDRWDSKKLAVDAVTAATKTLDPDEVAANLLKNIYSIIGIK